MGCLRSIASYILKEESFPEEVNVLFGAIRTLNSFSGPVLIMVALVGSDYGDVVSSR
jgi:hypothetical protein